MKKNERLQALRILSKLLQDKVSLSTSLQHPNLTPLTKELCFGVCRHYLRLECLADGLMAKRPKSLEVWIALLMGIYQLHFLRIPDYAVVKETVALMDLIKKSWAKGLLNAVLRRFGQQQTKLITEYDSNPVFKYNHPQWFIETMQRHWPKDWETILAANDTHPPMTLRVNQKQVSREHYLARLNDLKLKATPLDYSSYGIELKNPIQVHDLPGFSEGDVSVQDQAAQLAAQELDLKPGLRVLDACSAPGGKTCHILETEPRLAACIALDIEPKRLKRVEENLERLKLKATIKTGDVLKPDTWWDGKLFDRILFDAPCSATGVIRRHPDIKLLRTPEEVSFIVTLQKDMLTTLWPLLAPGGLLLYATCSVMPEENEQQMKAFAESHRNCHINQESKPWGRSVGYGWQILPGDNNMDGFFYCALYKART
ncbi:16S rRNA (cytosine(967)-C(5))-methyltransferase RsmB [Legionella impletisoli]|uniref:16S rRNA (cytosine(967)-C(5))-methyltransferase n=1 Tax=Legionella impletisoli TaxID=343510 RepID=A0A917JXA2_9GAMM|nr:16S rRNA (cytosine(967)-C(5))-methyltransferase RsmB [Legionella impletisoli]GGI88535.1 ribosomal RNA small subunit methyltransferase B [Legionella impletisoli]